MTTPEASQHPNEALRASAREILDKNPRLQSDVIARQILDDVAAAKGVTPVYPGASRRGTPRAAHFEYTANEIPSSATVSIEWIADMVRRLRRAECCPKCGRPLLDDQLQPKLKAMR